MVKFGNKLRELQISEWKDYYIQYKMIKKRLRNYALEARTDPSSRDHILREFSELLDRQVERTVLFLLEKQGRLAARLSRLGEEREALYEDANSSTVLQEAYREVGRDLLKLLQFVEMNATGLRKILKKFDKRMGYRLTDYYVATRSNHPYSHLQQVFRHVGIGAMVGSIAHNLAELQSQRGSDISTFYDSPHSITLKEPVIDMIKAAEERLTNSTSFLRFLGKQFIATEGLPEEIEEIEYVGMSVVLNLANTFLYMVNTYIIVPTADKYAMSLGAAPTLCGAIIGAMAVAQLVSSIYFSAWSNKSYFRPLVFSSVMLLCGNILYAVAYDWNSWTILLLGRLLCGFGSARAVNRRYISDCVPLKSRLKASAAFVSASALGMAAGPALAGFLGFNSHFLGFSLNSNTLPGWVMAACWLVYLVWLCFGFKEPAHLCRLPARDIEEGPADEIREGNCGEANLEQPLLLQGPRLPNSVSVGDDLDACEKDSNEDASSSAPATSFLEACRLLTLPVKVQLLIYFFLKFAMEMLLSESSVVSSYFFHWDTSSVALFLALLGLTVLPVNWIVGNYLSNMFEDRQILIFAQAFTCIGVVVSLSYSKFIPYTVEQYIFGSLLIFVSAEVLEGVNLSLLSRVMSSRLSRGTYNGGLLSTEAGTLARVLADAIITLSGYLAQSKLVNVTLLPTLLIGVMSITSTFLTYNSLF